MSPHKTNRFLDSDDCPINFKLPVSFLQFWPTFYCKLLEKRLRTSDFTIFADLRKKLLLEELLETKYHDRIKKWLLEQLPETKYYDRIILSLHVNKYLRKKLSNPDPANTGYPDPAFQNPDVRYPASKSVSGTTLMLTYIFKCSILCLFYFTTFK